MRECSKLLLAAIVLTVAFTRCTSVARTDSQSESGDKGLDYNTFCFYYNWYGNKEHDGKEIHWSHVVMKQGAKDTVTKGHIPGGDDIAANFFPALGTYSSTDANTVRKHMEMLEKARIGVIVLTWWHNADFGVQSVPLILEEAAKKNIKVAFHIEPFGGRNAIKTAENMKLIVDSYGSHAAFFRRDGLPVFFIYDSYLTPAEEWATVLSPNGKNTIRNTPYDATVIGLWVKKGEEKFFEKSGFDGFYTYFAATGFTYGSTPENWDYLQNWAEKRDKIFIPCVGPGYIDTRVRPWNGVNIRDRNGGAYYDKMYQDAIDSGAPAIGITSFNEWHEGTQIEPAVPFTAAAFDYLDYAPVAADYYLTRTAHWIGEFQKANRATK